MYSVFQYLLVLNNATVADVCRATGISQSTMSNWKSRDTCISIKNAQKIADYFGVSLEYLMTGKDTPKESTSGKQYYFDDETAEAVQEIFENPDLRALFYAARDCKPDALRLTAEMIKKLKETNPEG